MTRIDSGKLRDFCSKVLQKVDVPAKEAEIMAQALVEADLMGVNTHGVARLNIYLDHIENGTINPEPHLKVITDSAAVNVIDADRAMGPVAGDYAMKRALKKAKETGVGISSVRNSTHLGALSVTAKKAFQENMIGIVVSNTSPIMAPYGGREAVLGNNPIAFAVPTAEKYPCVLDMALSKTARGNIILAAREGKEIPDNWALNKSGEGTTDAEEALLGALLPLAEHKGYALALIFDILCGVLSGAAYGKNVGSFVPPDYSKPLDMGHFLLAIDIEKFIPFDQFQSRISDFLGQIKNSEKAVGFTEILIPGEKSSLRYQENLESGLILSKTTEDMLQKIAAKYGVQYD